MDDRKFRNEWYMIFTEYSPTTDQLFFSSRVLHLVTMIQNGHISSRQEKYMNKKCNEYQKSSVLIKHLKQSIAIQISKSQS